MSINWLKFVLLIWSNEQHNFQSNTTFYKLWDTQFGKCNNNRGTKRSRQIFFFCIGIACTVQSTTVSLLYRIFQILTMKNKNKFLVIIKWTVIVNITERFTFVFMGFIEPSMSMEPTFRKQFVNFISVGLFNGIEIFFLRKIFLNS